LLPTDPEGSRDLLRRMLANLQDDPDLTDRSRADLTNRLQNALRNVEAQGRVIERNREEQLRLVAHAQERLEENAKRQANEERTRERMRIFHNLMQEARYKEANQQALAIISDAEAEGQAISVAATGGYAVSLVSYNLRTLERFRRVREEQYLATMLEVERSFVPVPDEPPVHFPKPPFSTVDWHAITQLRKEKYESSGLFSDDPLTVKKVRDMSNKLNQPITLDKPIDPNTPLSDALEFLSDKYDITILIDTEAFKSDGVQDISSQGVKLPRMVGVSLATALRLLLSQVGATYIVRRDYLEITTPARQALEKTVRVYPVADLVMPIPNSVNQNVVNQNLALLGGTVQAGTANLGGALGALGIGGLGAGLGALGAGLGALGALGGGLGALGALGGGLGALGAGGLGALGGGIQGGAVGAGGFGLAGGGFAGAGGGFGGAGLGFQGCGAQNLGVGGGFAGFGGGALGQLGNLGGQFGLQGGDQSSILIKLITQVVGTPDEWLPPIHQNGGQGIAADPTDTTGASTPREANSLGYYPPALALMVKATSRIHTNVGGGLLAPRPLAPPPGGMGALDNPKPGALVIRPNSRIKRTEVAAAGDHRPDDQAVKKPEDIVRNTPPGKPVTDVDAKTAWQEALAKGVTDPGLIIATSDFLAEHGKFDHAAEFLKADLRQGIVADTWVYEALAIALKESKGSLEDIERAELSAVDVAPQDEPSYLKASKAMADLKRYDRALAFCQEASSLQPNAPAPYAEALLYAEMGKDSQAMEWAASNILGRDWPVDNQELHNKAREKLKTLAGLL
ncbi:MAG: hypothetical protein JO112_08335, partial [Planctomycetes bacterium]|nr:hypothetical protein [Planctomycetota bacterium]